jgi:hypothetical protein
MAVTNAVLNYRTALELEVSNRDVNAFGKRMQEVWREPEAEDAVDVPLDKLSEDKLRFHLYASMGVTLTQLGLELRQATPDFPAISKYLGDRYMYWTLDVPHDDPFGG